MSSTQQRLDEIAVQLRCYEPAGESVEFTERDLLGHTLITGGSGAGKTTRAIYPMLQQLIEHRLEDADARHSLVIYDTKEDGEVRSFLEHYCQKNGRQSELTVIAADDDTFSLDVITELKRDAQAVDTLAGLLSSSIPRDSVNKYWEMTFESMIKQALRLYVMGSNSLDYRSMVEFIIDYLLKARMRDPEIKERLENLDKDCPEFTDQQRALVDQVNSTHWMWDTLDHRTKSILQSMATPLLDGLNSPVAVKLLASGPTCQIADVVNGGGIVMISIDAIRYPEVARLVGCMVKGQFYDAILERTLRNRVYRPSGLFLDDWLLSATGGIGDRFSDVSALSIIRSRGGYVVAGCQSLASLDLVIGDKSRRAAFANFANLLFFRGRDAELDAYASAYFGQRSQTLVDHSIPQLEHPSPRNRPIRHEREVRVPAVPVGALARLPLGECYALIGDRIYDKPLCLIPTFAPET